VVKADLCGYTSKVLFKLLTLFSFLGISANSSESFDSLQVDLFLGEIQETFENAEKNDQNNEILQAFNDAKAARVRMLKKVECDQRSEQDKEELKALVDDFHAKLAVLESLYESYKLQKEMKNGMKEDHEMIGVPSNVDSNVESIGSLTCYKRRRTIGDAEMALNPQGKD
jgi:hypothetical protein